MGEDKTSLSRAETALLSVAALLVLGAHAFGAFLAHTQPVYDHATGSWFVIAHDVLNGTLYRPFESDLGLGGTRYFPLYPLLIALFVKFGLGYEQAGLLINLVSWALALGGAFTILRQLDVPRVLAGTFAVFSVGSFGTLMTMTSLRGDLLPVSLVLWGVVASLKARSGGFTFLIAAAMLFTLALAAKVTSLFWPAAVVVYLAVTGRTRQAAILSSLLLVGAAIFLLAINHLSEGRFLEMMAVTSSGGGSLFRFLLGPVTFEGMLRGADPLAYLATVVSVFLLVARFRQLGSSLTGLMFISVMVMTMAIFGSSGTIHNHLIDINFAAMLLLATRFGDFRIKPNLAPLVIVFYALLIPWRYDYQYLRDWEHEARIEAQNYLKSFDDPVLSEHPGIPLAIGRTPFLADAFMVNSLRQARPGVHARLQAELEAKSFNTIILSHVGEMNPYENGHFGGRFMEWVEENYERDRQFGPYVFFRPKRESEQGSP
jgi:hypothetical protein